MKKLSHKEKKKLKKEARILKLICCHPMSWNDLLFFSDGVSETSGNFDEKRRTGS